MMRAMFTAATGMNAQQLNVDTVANNLANVNTTGYKKSRADFQDLLYQTLRQPGAQTAAGVEMPVGVQVGHGVRTSAVSKVFLQGNVIKTENELDLVIQGKGFFQVLLPTGEVAYTRDGSFKRDSTGSIVTADGYPLQPAITIPEDDLGITVSSDGVVSATQPGSPDPVNLGTIELALFPNAAGLDARYGRNLFLETTASGAPVTGEPGGSEGAGTIDQGYLENSNVQVVEEILALIIAQRAYEANSNVIKTSDNMLQMANTMRR